MFYALAGWGAAPGPGYRLCHGPPGSAIPYSQQHVRNAMSGNGFWMIEVARAGTYEIELRRWPRELDLPMGDLVPAVTPDPKRHHAKSNLLQLPSRIVTVTKARLRVGDFDQTVPVEPDARAVHFELSLFPGPYALQTWLMDAQGSSRGAYYVAIRDVARHSERVVLPGPGSERD